MAVARLVLHTSTTLHFIVVIHTSSNTGKILKITILPFILDNGIGDGGRQGSTDVERQEGVGRGGGGGGGLSCGVGGNCCSPGLQRQQGKILNTQILNQQFSSGFNDHEEQHMPNKGSSPYDSMPDITVTNTVFEALLHKLNVHKATGPDNISAHILKLLATELAPVNHSLPSFPR